MLEAIRKSQEGMADEVLGNIVTELMKKITVGGFSEKSMQQFLERMWNEVEYDLNYSQKLSGQLEEYSDSKVIQGLLNGRNFKYYFWGGRFHMLP